MLRGKLMGKYAMLAKRSSRVMYVGLFLCTAFLFLSFFHTAIAQFMPNSTQTISLVPSPQFPPPLSTVEVSLDSYSINTTGSRIIWFVDGVEMTENANARSISVATGPIGTKTSVRAVVQLGGASSLSTSLTIVPTEVDIILETDTYVPSFYKGRALPSSGVLVRAIAVLHTRESVDPSTYTYTWSYNGSVLFGGPIRGKQVAEFTMPQYESDRLMVLVTNGKGEAVGRKVVVLSPADPELHFYEESPLRGMSRKAIRGDLLLIGDETTIRGEPYFMDMSPQDRSTTFEWSMDGSTIQNDSAIPNAITLRRTGGGGSAFLGLRILTGDTVPQYVEDGFTITFE